MNKILNTFILLAVLILSCSKEKEEKDRVIGPTNTLRPLIVKTFKLFGEDKIDQYLDECFITRQEIETLLTKYEYDGSINNKNTEDEYIDILNRKKIELIGIKATKKVYKFNSIFKNISDIYIIDEKKLDRQLLGESSTNQITINIISQKNRYEVRFSCIKTEERGWIMRGGFLSFKKID